MLTCDCFSHTRELEKQRESTATDILQKKQEAEAAVSVALGHLGVPCSAWVSERPPCAEHTLLRDALVTPDLVLAQTCSPAAALVTVVFTLPLACYAGTSVPVLETQRTSRGIARLCRKWWGPGP